jgi:hypothetical protein
VEGRQAAVGGVRAFDHVRELVLAHPDVDAVAQRGHRCVGVGGPTPQPSELLLALVDPQQPEGPGDIAQLRDGGLGHRRVVLVGHLADHADAARATGPELGTEGPPAVDASPADVAEDRDARGARDMVEALDEQGRLTVPREEHVVVAHAEVARQVMDVRLHRTTDRRPPEDHQGVEPFVVE